MSNGYTIQVRGIEQLNKLFTELPKQTQTGIENEMRAVGLSWVNAAKADVPVDRGRLKQSISFIVEKLSLTILAQSEQAAYMEFGTKKYFRAPAILGNYPSEFKGSSGSSVNPIEALTAWVKRKGLATNFSVSTRRRTSRSQNEARLERTIAYLIWRKIRKEGVKPQPFLFTGKDGSDRIEFFVEQIRKNIAAVLQQII